MVIGEELNDQENRVTISLAWEQPLNELFNSGDVLAISVFLNDSLNSKFGRGFFLDDAEEGLLLFPAYEPETNFDGPTFLRSRLGYPPYTLEFGVGILNPEEMSETVYEIEWTTPPGRYEYRDNGFFDIDYGRAFCNNIVCYRTVIRCEMLDDGPDDIGDDTLPVEPLPGTTTFTKPDDYDCSYINPLRNLLPIIVTGR
ncbi:MAG: hypothetical protein AAF639_39620 [Chloroflexota bacterium]